MNKIINNTLKISLLGLCAAVVGCSHTDSPLADHTEKNTASYFIKLGNDCIINQDYEGAFNNYLVAADKGNALAKRHVGYCYYAGQGVAQDYEKARIYFKEAVARDNTVAMYYLADMYLTGKGVEKNVPKALEYLEKSAHLKNEYAQTRLGLLYYFGEEGIIPDMDVAFDHFKKATRHGYSQALYNLGVMYYLGHGVAKNEAEAIKLMEQAARHKHEKALEFLSKTPEERAALDIKPSQLH